MVLNVTHGSKWEPYYEGPFQIEKRHQRGAYTLIDNMGNIMDRRFTIDQLKPVAMSADPIVVENQSYEVEAILDHQQSKDGYNYLVKWKFYPTSQNSWVPASDFNTLKPINVYW